MLLKPTVKLKSVLDIDVQLLNQLGVKAMILDLDNTLTLHGEHQPAAGVDAWIDSMKATGIKLLIVSNNTEKRVTPFAQEHGLQFFSNGCKPMTFAFTKAQRIFKLPTSKIAVVGDQLFTDVLGGNLKGMKTILVDPFQTEGSLFFTLKRKLERRILKGHKLERT